uniref:Rapamycin-insensitive companion of mTOR n=1 Tax=Syphacia muris TaxID=451379 RepID=A0A0N5AJR0_9BILA
MANDRDDRVRVSAVKALSACSETEECLSCELYDVIKKLCGDTEKLVRIEALKILKSFADRYGEREVNDTKSSMLLVDNAFTVVCHAVNDAEVYNFHLIYFLRGSWTFLLLISVRAEAATLLGKFSRVSDSFLLQTLDKKLLNAMRMSKVSVPRRSQSSFARRELSSSWSVYSSGKKLNECAPMEKCDDEQSSMIPTGACGAFVSALEDEFMVVRQAGVRSLGQLAANRPAFANMALDHLVDMFNDEIEEVSSSRCYSCTCTIGGSWCFAAGSDKLLDSREALRLLLAKANLGTSECLKCCLKALLNCMRLYPIDRQPTYRCLSHLGRRHASLVQPLVDELLGLDPLFDITEPALEDVYYLAKLILVLNAASEESIICEYLPSFAIQHYRYLRLSMPSIVPSIVVMVIFILKIFAKNGIRTTNLNIFEKRNLGKHAKDLLEKYYEALQEATKIIEPLKRRELYLRIKSDMDSLCEMDEEISGAAHFISGLLDVFSRYELVSQMILFGGDLLTAFNIAEQGLVVVDNLEYGFLSVGGALLALVSELRFRLRMIAIASRLILCPGLYENAEEVVNLELSLFKRRLDELSDQAMQSTVSLVNGFSSFLENFSSESKKYLDGRNLLKMFQSYVLVLPKKFMSLDGINTKWAEIVEPLEEDSDPVRFIAGLPVGIPFNVLLHNFEQTDIENFRMQITYPDMSTCTFCPRKRDYRYLPSKKVRLICDVCMVQSNPWSSPARVRVGCVFEVPLQAGIPLRNENIHAVPEVFIGRRTNLIPVPESLYCDKQAAVEVSIYPMFKQC